MHNNSEITKVEQLLKDSDITKPLVNYEHIAFMLGYEKAKEKFERNHGHWEGGFCTACGESAATDIRRVSLRRIAKKSVDDTASGQDLFGGE